MPRGVYDRTKSKEERAAEKAPAKKSTKGAKTAAAAPQKRKYTRRAAAPEKIMSAQKESIKHSATPDDSFVLMGEIRANLSVLTHLGDKFLDTPSLQAEVSAHVELLGKLREKVFATEESSQEVASEEDEAPVAAVANGASAYQGTVPLPPPPSVASVLPPPPIPAH